MKQVAENKDRRYVERHKERPTLINLYCEYCDHHIFAYDNPHFCGWFGKPCAKSVLNDCPIPSSKYLNKLNDKTDIF